MTWLQTRVKIWTQMQESEYKNARQSVQYKENELLVNKKNISIPATGEELITQSL